jgi:hypothetical protein
MGIWIRSQNRTELTNTETIYTDDRTVKVVDGAGHSCVGIYKSKERALEVIDEIQGHNERIEIAKLGGINCFETPLTYQMPKE